MYAATTATIMITLAPSYRFPCFLPPTPLPRIYTARFRSTPSSSARPSRTLISASSLDDSKRRAKSPYDNIPDLNQRYLAELSWVERKYGPRRLNKSIAREAQSSILRPDRRRPPAPQPTPAPTPVFVDGQEDTDTVAAVEAAVAAEDLARYGALRNSLLGNTLFIGALGLCGTWAFASVRDVTSFGVGLCGALAYVILLARSVDRLAESAKGGGVAGDALQPARVAVLVLLVVGSARNAERLSVLPVLLGFFTYKVATLVPLLTGEAFE